MSDSLSIVIIGAGKVGTGLHQLLSHSDHRVNLLGRSHQQQRAAVARADVVLLTVNDDAIRAVCEQLHEHIQAETVVAHCSGALDSQHLRIHSSAAYHVASAHPLNTFPTHTAAQSLFNNLDHGTYLCLEGDTDATAKLHPLFESLGFQILLLNPASKIHYHLACVFACNYLTALMDLSLETAKQAGLQGDQFWQAIQPLIQSTLRNIGEHGPANALSGPIARGDTSTIKKHLGAIHDDQRDAYTILAAHSLKLAKTRGELSAEHLEQLKHLLS